MKLSKSLRRATRMLIPAIALTVVIQGCGDKTDNTESKYSFPKGDDASLLNWNEIPEGQYILSRGEGFLRQDNVDVSFLIGFDIAADGTTSNRTCEPSKKTDLSNVYGSTGVTFSTHHKIDSTGSSTTTSDSKDLRVLANIMTDDSCTTSATVTAGSSYTAITSLFSTASASKDGKIVSFTDSSGTQMSAAVKKGEGSKLIVLFKNKGSKVSGTGYLTYTRIGNSVAVAQATGWDYTEDQLRAGIKAFSDTMKSAGDAMIESEAAGLTDVEKDVRDRNSISKLTKAKLELDSFVQLYDHKRVKMNNGQIITVDITKELAHSKFRTIEAFNYLIKVYQDRIATRAAARNPATNNPAQPQVRLNQEEATIAKSNSSGLARDANGQLKVLTSKGNAESYAAASGFNSQAAGQYFDLGQNTGGLVTFASSPNQIATATNDMIAHMKGKINANSYSDLELAFVL